MNKSKFRKSDVALVRVSHPCIKRGVRQGEVFEVFQENNHIYRVRTIKGGPRSFHRLAKWGCDIVMMKGEKTKNNIKNLF